MENNHTLLKEKMEISDILKRSLKISYQNTNFTIFIFLTSLPLLTTMVFNELILQTTLVQASKILEPPYSYFYHNWPIPTYLQGRLSKDFCLKLIQLGFLYLVPLHLLELFTMIVTVDLSSKLYSGETPLITLRQMVQRSVKEARFKAPFITSIFVLYLSTCTLLGLTWLVIHYYFISRNIFHGYFFVVPIAAAFTALLRKYLEWSALWNMSMVISVLEGMRGAEAIALSDYFSRNSNKHGMFLMLVFFVWGFGLRSLCLVFGCYRRVGGVIVPVSLICLGNVIKWVACMVYFYDCRERSLEVGEEKTVDAEALVRGRDCSQEVTSKEEMKPEAEADLV